MFHQVLATGVHGILLCHADTPGAVRAFVEAVRFPAYGGRPRRARQSDGGAHLGNLGRRVRRAGRCVAAQSKGRAAARTEARRQVALENAEANAKVPGVAFAEWGPGDMAFSLGVKNGPGPLPPLMQAARSRVFAATKASKIFFLNSMNADNVVDMIKEGVMIGPASREAAEIGRKFTKRTMPW